MSLILPLSGYKVVKKRSETFHVDRYVCKEMAAVLISMHIYKYF